jgi:hypothetical protein
MEKLTKMLLYLGVITFFAGCQQQDINPDLVRDEQSLSSDPGDYNARMTPADHRNYNAHLSAPEGVDSQGQGQAIFRFSKDGNELYYKLIVANIENIIMAHIHLRPNAQTPNGPPVLWLIPDGPPPLADPVTTNGVLVEGTVTSANLVGPLASGSLADLKAKIREGLTYVNVHTPAYPGGEIRGDIK